MFIPVVPSGSLGWPSWIIVRPDLTVLDFASGYSDFTPIESAIVADHG